MTTKPYEELYQFHVQPFVHATQMESLAAYDEGRNPLGLKFIRLGLDTVIYDPESRMIYTPNTKEWASIDQKGGGEPIAGRDPSG